VIDEARERQKEFEASAYAHRQRMILDLQVTAVVVRRGGGCAMMPH
jgi:hypothetical protein